MIQKNIAVKDDEKYLEGINLVTGDKIDYSRRILSQTQINLLCVSQKLSKVDKFIVIMTKGQKIQKWSLFQNITLYIESVQSAEKIFVLLQKNYSEYDEFISIMGEGFAKYLNICSLNQTIINKKCYDTIFRTLLRTLTSPKYQGSQILSDWMLALNAFFRIPPISEAVNAKTAKLAELNEFINGSFSMNTLPERRKTALEMINALIGQSQQVENQAHSKILFFNGDLNPMTRLVICKIIQKILTRNNVPQIWKCVVDYYFADKSSAVKEKALQIISKIYFKPNAEYIFNEFDCDRLQTITMLTNYLAPLLKTYENQIKKEPMYQLKVFSLLNRLLRENMEIYLSKVVDCYRILVGMLPETVLVNQLQFKNFSLESMTVIGSLIELASIVNHIEFKQELKKQINRGLRYHQFYVKTDVARIRKLMDLLDLSVDQDINIFILLFSKQIDNSKWKNIIVFLDKIKDIKFYQSHLEKMGANILKIYSNCPYFLLQKIHQVIFWLSLIDRKGMDVYIKIREKCLGSKNWMLRRNFIKLYIFFKVNGSFELNKSITPIVYKNVVNEKNTLIKLQFVSQFIKAYSYLDSSLPQEKITIKEVISRFSEDKDKQLSSLSLSALELIKQIDRNYELIHQRLTRNKQLLNQEVIVEQVLPDARKHVKTEKLIGKDVKQLREKPKKGSMLETKAINLGKLNPIQKNKQIIPEKLPMLSRSTSTQNKKQGPKIFVANYKKSRFV